MREIFTEIWSSMRKNKLRTFLTGFSVAWGILMLIILLSSGNGLQNGMMSNFDYMATNSIELYSSRTSMPYAGYAEGRSIYLSGKDIEILEEEFPNVDKVTSSAWYSGGTMTRGKIISTSPCTVSAPNIPKYSRLRYWRDASSTGRTSTDSERYASSASPSEKYFSATNRQ